MVCVCVRCSLLLLQAFASPKLHEANFVHACCLKSESPNPSTYDYQRDATFCEVCEEVKQEGREQNQEQTQATLLLESPEKTGVTPARGAPPPQSARSKKTGLKSKSGPPIVAPPPTPPPKVPHLFSISPNFI